MKRSERSIQPKFAIIAAGVLAIIIYGSLFPFDFHARASPAGVFTALMATRSTPGRRGDLIANILLYSPLGFFSVLAFCSRPRFGHVLLVVFAGLALSTGIESVQFYDRGRDSALSDVFANTAGAGLGAVAGVLLYRKMRLATIGDAKQHPFVVLLLASWLGYRLFPYVLTIDLHNYWHAVRPLLFAPRPPILDLYRHTADWLAIALLIEALVGKARSRLALALFIPVVILARVLVADARLSAAEVEGSIIAAVVWIGLLWRLQGRVVLISVIFAGSVVIRGLHPFQFSARARPFSWVPFRSFMQGSVTTNISSFFEKTFAYGTLIWLFCRAGCTWRTATLLGGALVLCLRLGQVYIPGRSAEITDVVMLLTLAAMMKLMSENPPA